jgi:lysophospholipase L1-like esterase
MTVTAAHSHRQHFKPRARHKRRHAACGSRRVLAALAVMALASFPPARAQSAPSSQMLAPQPSSATTVPPAGRESAAARRARWNDSFERFAAADRAHAPPPGGVLFVGSSSIRLWEHLAEDFATLPVVIQRGFGGSRLSDCSDNLSRLVLPYKPSVVIVYAGDNDLAEGATPAEVLDTFKRFVKGVRAELPDTHIAYVSIKPSPLRAALLEQVRAANELIRTYSASLVDTHYVDVYSKMLGADGKPRPELFGTDRLHLNRAGYSLWKQEISRHLSTMRRSPTQRPAAAAAPRAGP